MGPAEEVRLRVSAEGSARADASRHQRLFENLFSNAVTHTDGPLTIEVGDLEEGFYVADAGGGTDPEIADRLFDPRVTTGNGPGLGLAIVAEIADAHGWPVTATDGKDGGVRFEFTGVSRP